MEHRTGNVSFSKFDASGNPHGITVGKLHRMNIFGLIHCIENASAAMGHVDPAPKICNKLATNLQSDASSDREKQ